MKTRKETYEQKQNELLERCRVCCSYNSPPPECCEFCGTGKELILLETAYADVNDSKNERMLKKEV
ncbi:MAG: hypothetical protein J6J60_03040 [Clostridia bacterium]|nr:hypothetical protein [Clostridia bacterium]